MTLVTGYDKEYFKNIKKEFISKYGIEKWRKLKKKLESIKKKSDK